MRAENKVALVAAHRAGDEEACKRLSQERERLKENLFCKWPECDVPVRGQFCHMHLTMHKFYRRSLNGFPG